MDVPAQSQVLMRALIDGYEQAERTPGSDDVVTAAPPVEAPTPPAVQAEALEALAESRAEGFAGGPVVMATGLGKTWLAAFDATRPQFRRVGPHTTTIGRAGPCAQGPHRVRSCALRAACAAPRATRSGDQS